MPFEGGFPLLAVFTGNIVQEFVIAGKAAAILRRASPLPTKKLRVRHTRFGSLQFFDNDPVLPVIAHVIDVADLSYDDA